VSDEDLQGKAYDHRLMRRLLGYLGPYRVQMAVAALLVMAEKLVSLAGPILTKDAIDNGIRHRDLGHVDRIALLYLGTLLAQFVLGYFNAVLIQRVGQHVMLDLRGALFRQLQRLPVSFYDRNPIGRLMTRVTNDVDVLNEFATAGMDALFGDLVLILGTAGVMLSLNAELTGVAFSVLPLIAIVTLVFRVKVRASFRDVRTRLARMNAFLNENLGGMTTVQLLNREPRNLGLFRDVNAGHREANLQTVFYHAVFFSLIELLSALALGLIIWYGGRQVMWSGITLGTLVAFMQYTLRFYRPISDISEKYGILQQAMASSERIFDLLDTKADPAAAIPAVEPAKPVPGGEGDGRSNGRGPAGPAPAIEFDRVWFAYSDENWVLRSGPRAPARPRASACCFVSTSRSGARSGWTACR
jgi:ATP-binding cassette subfamily B protein